MPQPLRKRTEGAGSEAEKKKTTSKAAEKEVFWQGRILLEALSQVTYSPGGVSFH